jgi:hypothetical protein
MVRHVKNYGVLGIKGDYKIDVISAQCHQPLRPLRRHYLRRGLQCTTRWGVGRVRNIAGQVGIDRDLADASFGDRAMLCASSKIQNVLLA